VEENLQTRGSKKGGGVAPRVGFEPLRLTAEPDSGCTVVINLARTRMISAGHSARPVGSHPGEDPPNEGKWTTTRVSPDAA